MIPESKLNNTKPVIIYDEVCVLCNFWVRKLLKFDRKGLFKFAYIHSDFTEDFTHEDGGQHFDPQLGVVLVEGNRLLQGVEAVIRIAEILGGWWKMVLVVRIFPVSVQKWGYRVVANNRYRWFGKRNPSCDIGWRKYSDRFLS